LREAADDAGARPMAELGEDGTYFYDGFRVHACSPPYALVESSRRDTGYALFWLLEAADGRWAVRASTAIDAATPPGRPLFDCDDLADDGTDTAAMRTALGPGEAGAGRPLCS
jgi:hypothetical protein